MRQLKYATNLLGLSNCRLDQEKLPLDALESHLKERQLDRETENKIYQLFLAIFS